MPKKDLSTEAKILEAARSVFHRKGMHGARMQDIADQAGINKALLHYYFRSKEQLFESVFREALAQVIPKFRELWESDRPLPEKIESFVSGYIDVLIENPFLPAFVLHEINQDPDQFERLFLPPGTMQKNKKFLQGIVVQSKNKKIKEVDPRQLMVNMMSLCIFPFAARPMICKMIGMKDSDFREFMLQRKKLIPAILIQSIKNS